MVERQVLPDQPEVQEPPDRQVLAQPALQVHKAHQAAQAPPVHRDLRELQVLALQVHPDLQALQGHQV